MRPTIPARNPDLRRPSGAPAPWAMRLLPNLLSLLRLVLLLGLFAESGLVRASSIILAALSDFFDGYLARKLKTTSRLGTLLDPITDKVFVLGALGLFLYEGMLSHFELLLFLLRDCSLLLFSLWLWMTRSYQSWQIQSFICGKLMTTCQFIALFLLAVGYPLPASLLWAMALFGVGSFFELVLLKRRKKA